MTGGMLLREAILDSNLSQYQVIILDEAHERNIDSDVLMALVKGICARRSAIRIVVMSATLELTKFRNYFGSGRIIEVEGRSHAIEVYNTASPQLDYVVG